MRSVRVAIDGISPGERRLEGAPMHYLVHVHRLSTSETFVAFDPAARAEARGEILRLDREAVIVRLGESEPARAVPPFDVTLLQCTGKGDKVDDVVRAATALGVRALVVVESSRSVARIEGERATRRRERWRAVALDAARQSGRGDVPEVEGPRPFADVLASLGSSPATKLCLDPEATLPFAGALPSPEKPVVLLVGPEGGLSDDELALADRTGFSRVRLGPFVLRTELAGAAALAVLLSRTPT